jgi:hypothetical protein
MQMCPALAHESNGSPGGARNYARVDVCFVIVSVDGACSLKSGSDMANAAANRTLYIAGALQGACYRRGVKKNAKNDIFVKKAVDSFGGRPL